MTPNATKLIVAHSFISCHAKSIRYFPLLFYRKQNVALNSEDECRNI